MIKESGIVERLKPCPFCGGPAEFENLVFEAVIRCSECCATLTRAHAAKSDTGTDQVISAWNIRPAATLIAELQAEREQRKLLSLMTGPSLIDRAEIWRAEAYDLAEKLDAAESSIHRVRAETIEECAKLAEQFPGGDPWPRTEKVQNNLIAASIRSLNITGLDTGAVKTAESSHSPSTLNAETE